MAITDKAYLGGISVKVQTPDFAVRGKENIRLFRQQMRAAHEQGIQEGIDILQEVLYEKDIFDTGDLIESVASKLFIRTSDVFEGDIHFRNPGKEYAYFVEHGRGPGHPPPVEKMKDWGERKGLTFWHTLNIRDKIGREGTKARPFMSEAERDITLNYDRIVLKAIDKFIRRKR